ncbi:hypothetical protein LV89_03468 [Arcicella aurantiaca]|uniref:ParB-like nuclease family protein n=1 Tax=Arcicella aurantiaca TaxID=591202 RepID=A0A316E0W0_9BACT|nr:hypothetical protein [Arcicella aurantiaca]PWK22403.1 hypothetical protein LV89_03468 [Arcicella aurantiaca]
MAKLNLRDSIKAKAQSTISNGLVNNENIKKKIIIVDELKELIKPLQSDEYEQLKANIIQNGCQDTIKIWQTFENVAYPNSESMEEVFVLVDGHNRWKICTENQIPYNISLLHFDTLEDVKSYMIDLQLGRRNVSPLEVSYYRGLQYNRFKWIGLQQNNEEESKKTAVAIGEQYNVDERTIRRDGQFAEGLEMLTKELKTDVLGGKVKVSKKDLQKLAKIQSSASATEPVKKIETIDEINDLISPMSVQEVDNNINLVAISARNTLNEFLQSPSLENYNELEKTLVELKNLIL